MSIIIKEPLNTEKQENFIKKYIISACGTLTEFGDVEINESHNSYKVTILEERKMDAIELSIMLSEFVNSEYFLKSKPIILGEQTINIHPREPFNSMLSKVRLVLKKY